MSARRHRPVRLALALLVGLVLVELGLRAAGWIYLAAAGDRAGSGAEAELLCHGDSCVFGLWVAPDETYPAQLQRALELGVTAPAPRVVNLGMPGMNTRMLRQNLPRELERYAPRTLLLTVGANNSWTWRSGADIYYESPPWYEDLRLVKLARLLVQRRSAAAPEDYDPSVELSEGEIAHVPNREGDVLRLDEGGERRALAEAEMQATILEDLRAIDATARAHDVRLALVTYGSELGIYGQANRALRAAAEELRVPLFDTAAAAGRRALDIGFDRVFFEDGHPQPEGYRVIAASVYEQLRSAQWIAGEPIDLGEPGERAEIHAVADATGALAIELSGGPPGREFRLLLWAAAAAGEELPRHLDASSLQADPLYRLTMNAEWTRARFDEYGAASVPLTSLASLFPGASLHGLRMRAAYIVFGRAGGGWNLRTSPVELALP